MTPPFTLKSPSPTLLHIVPRPLLLQLQVSSQAVNTSLFSPTSFVPSICLFFFFLFGDGFCFLLLNANGISGMNKNSSTPFPSMWPSLCDCPPFSLIVLSKTYTYSFLLGFIPLSPPYSHSIPSLYFHSDTWDPPPHLYATYLAFLLLRKC